MQKQPNTRPVMLSVRIGSRAVELPWSSTALSGISDREIDSWLGHQNLSDAELGVLSDVLGRLACPNELTPLGDPHLGRVSKAAKKRVPAAMLRQIRQLQAKQKKALAERKAARQAAATATAAPQAAPSAAPVPPAISPAVPPIAPVQAPVVKPEESVVEPLISPEDKTLAPVASPVTSQPLSPVSQAPGVPAYSPAPAAPVAPMAVAAGPSPALPAISPVVSPAISPGLTPVVTPLISPVTLVQDPEQSWATPVPPPPATSAPAPASVPPASLPAAVPNYQAPVQPLPAPRPYTPLPTEYSYGFDKEDGEEWEGSYDENYEDFGAPEPASRSAFGELATGMGLIGALAWFAMRRP